MIDYQVLGPIEARRDGVPVNLGGPQQRRLLAVLLANQGRAVPLDRLEEALWPAGDAPAGARKAVITYVSRVRSALGGGITTSANGYVLDPGEALDAVAFEQRLESAKAAPSTQRLRVLGEALAMWKGPAFGDLAGEWWARPAAARLEELRLVVAEEHIETMLELGSAERAVSELEGLLLIAPLRERLVGQQMRALFAAGRQADALRSYQLFRKRLVDETGLDPSPALAGIERSIASGERPQAMAPGRVARGYVLGDAIAQGSYGTVFRATQPGVGREVAVKVIRPEQADDPLFVERFDSEAQLIAQLEHPHIVPLYDFWREPGGAYLVFRLMRGGTAEQSLANDGQWPLARVARLADEVGSAISTAHGRGVVHCDVKPANVFLDDAGHCHLGDFGIAVRQSGPGAATGGSLLYASPEQITSGAATVASDIYGLAVTMWELLTATAPWTGTAEDVRREKTERALPPLRQWRPEVGDLVDGVLRKATAVQPEERYASVDAFIGAWHIAIGHLKVGSTADAPGAPRPSRAVADNPYKGLRAFREADATVFFGRAALTDDLVDIVGWSRATTVVGPSGSGKSSLVAAGLVPRLRQNRHRVASMHPTDQPLAQLRNALSTIATRPLHSDGAQSITRVAYESDHPIALIIDQFEELWTLTDVAERERFIDVIATAAGDTSIDVRLVLVIRADFFDRPLADSKLGPLLGDAVFTVRPMTAPEISAAVRAPAQAAGLEFEGELDAEIVADVIAQGSSLPLLQFAMTELYERRKDSVIRSRAYREMGGVAGAIAERAESLFGSLDPSELYEARRLFSRLVIPGAGADDTRRRARRSELPEAAQAIADQFVRHRLLVADHDPATREPTVEIAHEALLGRWPRLRQWIDDDREQLQLVQHVAQAATSWDAGGRVDTDLYRGPRLALAGELSAQGTVILSPLEDEFVTASQAAHDAAQRREVARIAHQARQNRRLRYSLAAVAALLAVAVIAGLLAIAQRRRADDRAAEAASSAAQAAVSASTAEAARRSGDIDRLVAQAQADASEDQIRAALLAVEAWKREPGWKTAGAIQSVLSQIPKGLLGYVFPDEGVLGQPALGRTIMVAPNDDRLLTWSTSTWARSHTIETGSRVAHVALSNDENYIAAGLDDGVAIFAVGSGERVIRLAAGAQPMVRFDPTSSERLATASREGELTVWNWRTGRVEATSERLGDTQSFQFSPDGRTLASTHSTDGQVRLWNARSLQPIRQISAAINGRPVNASEFSPDSTLIVGLDPLGNSATVFRASDGAAVTKLTIPADMAGGPLQAAFFDAQSLLVQSGGGVHRFDAVTGQEIRPRLTTGAPLMAVNPVRTLLAAKRGNGLAITSLTNTQAGARASYPLPAAASLPQPTGTTNNNWMEVTADSKFLFAVFGNESYRYRLGAPDSQPERIDLPGEGTLMSMRLTPGGQSIVTTRLLNGRHVFQRFDPATLQPNGAALAVTVFAPNVNLFTVSHDERYLALAQFERAEVRWTIEVYELATSRLVHRLSELHGIDMRGMIVLRPNFTADGRRLAVTTLFTTTGVIGQWDLTQSPPKFTTYDVSAHRGPAAFNIEYDRTGRLLAAADSGEGTLHVFDTTSGQLQGEPLRGRASFRPHWHPTDAYLITDALCGPSTESTNFRGIALWDMTTKVEIGKGFPMNCGVWFPDGKSFAGKDTTSIQVWDFDQRAWAVAACRFAGRELTAKEWERYGPREPQRPTCADLK